MRVVFGFVLAFLASTGFAATDCLEESTNSELLRELERRIGGTGGNQTAVASFSCDSQTNLQISVVGANGEEQTAEIYLGSSSRCSEAATVLQRNRGRITATSVFAVCDSTTNLFRYSVTPMGALKELSRRYIGSSSACAEEMGRINSNP